MEVPKPRPVADARSGGFWSSAARHELSIQRCTNCRRLPPPVVVCPACLSTTAGFSFVPVSGRGRLRTWTIMRDAFLPGFKTTFHGSSPRSNWTTPRGPTGRQNVGNAETPLSKLVIHSHLLQRFGSWHVPSHLQVGDVVRQEAGKLNSPVAIVGYSLSGVQRRSSRPLGTLAIETALAAILDAGLGCPGHRRVHNRVRAPSSGRSTCP